MKITVIGAGNIGTQFAVQFSVFGAEVTIFTSDPEKINDTLYIVDENDNVVASTNKIKATGDINEAVCEADYIFVTYPAFMMKNIADKMYDHVKSGTKIGLIPGTGGGEFCFKKYIDKGIVIFGLQRVPGVARLKKYGETVCITGLRDRMYLGSIPSLYSNEIARLMSQVFTIPCSVLPNYLCVTLTPSNPILHTTRLCTLFGDYSDGVVYPRNTLFYEEWSDESSELLLACDDELQQVCKKLDKLDLSQVRSLKLHYESNDVKSLTSKIRSIKSLHGLESPMIKVDGGYIPDFSSRYFTADFPYGLAILRQIAHISGVDVPNMEATLDWYENTVGNRTEFRLSDYDINTVEDIYNFYCG